MFTKFIAIVLALGATACMLLVIRQQRLETAHEMSAIHQRLTERQHALLTLRIEIAGACRPDQLRLAMAEIGGGWMAVETGRPAAAPARTARADSTRPVPDADS
ncbi:MAG: hypothetical protein ACYSTY_01110 [Planctomycetota bacterium]|jgi:hypothetical protein